MTILASIIATLIVLWCIGAIAGSARMSSLISRKEEERDAADAIEHFTKVPK